MQQTHEGPLGTNPREACTQPQRACPVTSAIRIAGTLMIALMVASCSPGSLNSTTALEDASASARSDARAEHRVDSGTTSDHDSTAVTDVHDAGHIAAGDVSVSAHTCQDPHSAWLLCEDFEDGNGNFDRWLAASDFISGVGTGDGGRIRLADDHVHAGSWAVHMPAAASSGYQGASLDWRDCDGTQRTDCTMNSHEVLYFRAWIRFAPDHRYVHHFLNIGGSQPDDYGYHGTAGCLPNGELSMGATVDFKPSTHESHFYTYSPDMSCDTNCESYLNVDQRCEQCATKGLPTCTEQKQCCWGNHFAPDPPVAFPLDQWFCLEMMVRANTVGQQDGAMAYWVNDRLAHRVDESSPTPIWWRSSPTLALNRVRLQHYITTDDAKRHSNRVWFDDVVVSTERIGCN